jgi:lipopolysaccharide export system permease protein
MEVQAVLRPRILEEYVAREFLKLLGLSLTAFVSVYLIVDFFEKIDRLVRADLGPWDLCRYLLLKLPLAVGQVLPAAVLLGVVLCFGLLSRTRETLAVRTCGLDILNLSRPIFLLAASIAAGLLTLNLYLIPWSQGRLNLFWETQVQKKPPPSLVRLEHFWYKGDQAMYNIVLFRQDIETLEGVKVYLFDRHFHLNQIITAHRAQWQGDHWRFYQGHIQTFGPAGLGRGESFRERDLVLTERPQDFASLDKKVTEMDIHELYRYIQRLERDGYKSTSYRLEFQNRLSLSLTPLILALLGLGLAIRQEQTFLPAMVAVGLGLMFGYWVLLGFCVSLGQAGRWPVLMAAWTPHFLFGLLGLALLRQVTR